MKTFQERIKESILKRKWHELDEDLDIPNIDIQKMDMNFTTNLHMVTNWKHILKQCELHVNKSGVCILTSLYNSFPELFLSIENLEDLINTTDNYFEYESVITIVNNKFFRNNNKIRDISQPTMNNKIKDVIKTGIDNNLSIPFGYDSLSGGHFVNLLGYSDSYYYYFENGDEEVLLLDLVECYVQSLRLKELFFEEIKRQHKTLYSYYIKYKTGQINIREFYNKITPLIQSNFIDLGFSYEISSIKKDWLYYLRNINTVVYDISLFKNFADGYRRIMNTTFSDLTKRLNKINQKYFSYDYNNILLGMTYDNDTECTRTIDELLRDRKGICYDFVNYQYFKNNKKGHCYFMWFNNHEGSTHTIYVDENNYYIEMTPPGDGTNVNKEVYKEKVDNIEKMIEKMANDNNITMEHHMLKYVWCEYIPTNKHQTIDEFIDERWDEAG